MREHELKCWPEPFQAVVDGRKRFEWRYDDRGYAVGDVLILKEFDPHTNYYVGPNYRTARVVVTYVLAGRFGMPERYVCMSIEPEATRYRAALDGKEAPK